MDIITIIAIWLANHLGITSIVLPVLVFALLGYVAAAIANRQCEKDKVSRRIKQALGKYHV